MSSGNRCKSPALHTGDFCFFHDRFHADARNAKFDTLRLPVPEDLASVLQALSRISSALIDSRIDTKRAAQLIWIQQLAMQAIARRAKHNADSIQRLTPSEHNEELAPKISICIPGTDCNTCVHKKYCANSPHLNRDSYGDGVDYRCENEIREEDEVAAAQDFNDHKEKDADKDDANKKPEGNGNENGAPASQPPKFQPASEKVAKPAKATRARRK